MDKSRKVARRNKKCSIRRKNRHTARIQKNKLDNEKMLNIISPNTVEGQSNSDVTPIYTNPFDEFELVDDIQPTKRYCIIS